jgi:hypothetical protein
MQGVEVGVTCDAQHHSFTIEHKMGLPDLQRRLDDPGKAVGPVVAATGIWRTLTPAVRLSLSAVRRKFGRTVLLTADRFY